MMRPYYLPGEKEFFANKLKSGYSNGNIVGEWVYLFRPGIYWRAVEELGYNPANQELVQYLCERNKRILIEFRRHQRYYLINEGYIKGGFKNE